MKTQKLINGLTIEQQYFFSTVILFFFITILYIIQDTIGYETVSIILLLIIFLLPLFNFSKGPIVLSALISALAWDYYFIPPHFTMHIAKTEDAVMLFMTAFLIMLKTDGAAELAGKGFIFNRANRIGNPVDQVLSACLADMIYPGAVLHMNLKTLF